MDKLSELVDKCASTRGAPAAAELFQHIAQLLSEDVERDSRPELRSALVRVARAGAAARSNNPRAALALLDGAWLRCRDERDRATLLAEAERLHPAAVAASTFAAAAHDAWPDAGDAAPPAMNTAPHVYERAVAAWPAVTRWRSPRYWIAELGARIVPVEVGVAYRDSDALAQQRLVPFGEYVDSVLLKLARGEEASLGGTVCAVSEVVPVTSARTVAYLARTGVQRVALPATPSTRHPRRHSTRCSSSARSCRETPGPGRGSCKRPSRAGRARSEASSPSFLPGWRPAAPRRLSITIGTPTTCATSSGGSSFTCGPHPHRSRATRLRPKTRRRSTPRP